MKKILNLYILAAIAYSCFMFSCAGSKKTKVDPYVGEWEYTAPTQDGGEMNVVMTIEKTEDAYSGYLSSDMGSVDLQDLVIKESDFAASFEIGGYVITMKGAFEGDTYTGTSAYEENEWPMNATRKQALAQ